MTQIHGKTIEIEQTRISYVFCLPDENMHVYFNMLRLSKWVLGLRWDTESNTSPQTQEISRWVGRTYESGQRRVLGNTVCRKETWLLHRGIKSNFVYLNMNYTSSSQLDILSCRSEEDLRSHDQQRSYYLITAVGCCKYFSLLHASSDITIWGLINYVSLPNILDLFLPNPFNLN